MTGARVSLGVDGGQTTLRLAVAGTELRAERAGFSYRHSDPYGEQLAAIRDCWEEVGRPGPVGRVVLGLTGAPSAAERRAEFAAAVGDLLDADEVWLSGDVVTAHCGALPDGHGVVLAAGTGTACLGMDAGTGDVRTVDARGFLFGDDGSAFAVGRAGIAASLRALDGRGPATALTDAATARYGPPARLTQRLYASPTVVADTAAFAVDVDTAAARGDHVATATIATAADDLHRTVVAAAAVVTGEPVPVAGTGRWLGAPTLHRMLRERLAAEPGLRLVPATGDALDGACRLAVATAAGAYRPLFHVHERRCHR